MLFELIGNAIKFTNKGNIIVKVKDYNEELITVKIKDTGEGMSEYMC